MIFLGLGSCVGGPFNGFLIDKFGLKKAALMILAQTVAACGVLIAFTYTFTWNVYFCSAFTFLWGMQDSGVMNFIYSCCGFEFDSKTAAFSVFHFLHSFFCFAMIFIQAFITTPTAYIVYFSCIGAFAVFAYLLFIFAFELKEDQKVPDFDEITVTPDD